MGVFSALGAGLGAGLGIIGGNRAASKQIGDIDRASEEINSGLTAITDRLTPTSEAGQRGLSRFEAGTNRSLSDIIAGIEDNPAYKFQLGQGMDAIEGSAAAGGNLRSGRTLKALTEFSQGLASNQIDKEFNRNQINLDRLLQLTQLGANADNTIANAQLTSSNQLADLLMNRGQVKAGREMNKFGSISQGLGGIIGSLS